jgi:hypothetical protein
MVKTLPAIAILGRNRGITTASPEVAREMIAPIRRRTIASLPAGACRTIARATKQPRELRGVHSNRHARLVEDPLPGRTAIETAVDEVGRA